MNTIPYYPFPRVEYGPFKWCDGASVGCGPSRSETVRLLVSRGATIPDLARIYRVTLNRAAQIAAKARRAKALRGI